MADRERGPGPSPCWVVCGQHCRSGDARRGLSSGVPTRPAHSCFFGGFALPAPSGRLRPYAHVAPFVDLLTSETRPVGAGVPSVPPVGRVARRLNAGFRVRPRIQGAVWSLVLELGLESAAAGLAETGVEDVAHG